MSRTKAAVAGMLALGLLAGQWFGGFPIAAGVSAAETGMAQASSPQKLDASGKPVYVPDEVLVKFKPAGTARMSAQGLKSGLSLTTVDTFEAGGTEVVKIASGASVESVIAALQASGAVESAQPNYLYYASTIQDPYWGNQWGLHNFGQSMSQPGIDDVDIDAPGGWEHAGLLQEVKVAVLDTGIDINHPDLQGKIDPDGWDFYHNDNTVFDPSNVYENELEDAHGTHVAGILAAAANDIGIRGVAPNVKLLPLKFLGGSDGSGTTADAIKAIQYAADHGAQVINASWGGVAGVMDTALNSAIAASGLVFVAAAGNGDESGRGFDIDDTTFSPAGLPASNIISVAAIDNRGQLAEFSNYGDVSVDVAAPGVDIYSTFPHYSNGSIQHTYAYASGTSMAAPFVSGVAAMLIGKRQSGTTQTIAMIKQYGKRYNSLLGKTESGNMGNLDRAMQGSEEVILDNDIVSASSAMNLQLRLGKYGIPAGGVVRLTFPDSVAVPATIPQGTIDIQGIQGGDSSVSQIAVNGQDVQFTVDQQLLPWQEIRIRIGLNAGFRNPGTAGVYTVEAVSYAATEKSYLTMKVRNDGNDLRVGETSDTSALLYWNNIPDSTILFLYQSADGGASWSSAATAKPIASGDTYATVLGLNASTTYWFRILFSLNGQLFYSNVLETTTPSSSPPQLFSVQATSTTASFIWKPFASDAATYSLEQSEGDSNQWTASSLIAPMSNAALHATVKNLAPNTTYKFRLAARLSDRTIYSSPIDVVTPSLSAVGSVTGFVYGNVTPSQVNLSWNPITGEAQLDLYRSTDGGTTWTMEALGGGIANYLVKGLTPSTGYRFRLVASNGESESVSQDLDVATPPLDANVEQGVLHDILVRGNTTLELVFNKAVQVGSATAAANYVISSLQVVNAAIDPNNPAKVKLTTSPMAAGRVYTLATTVRDSDDKPVQVANPIFTGFATSAPPILQYANVSGSFVTLGYSESLWAAAPDPQDFSIGIGGAAAVHPLSTAVAGPYVVLELGQSVVPGTQVSLSYRGNWKPLRSAYTRARADDLTGQSLQEVSANPVLLTMKPISNQTMELVFSEPMAASSVRQLSNYEIRLMNGGNPGVTVIKAEPQPDPRRVRITLSDMQIGYLYQITVSGVTNTSGRLIRADRNFSSFIFYVSRRIEYSTASFEESASNTGASSTVITATLVGGNSFTGSEQEDFIKTGKAVVRNVPAGMVPVVKRTGASTVQLSLTGQALTHASVNSANLRLDFADSAFAAGTAQSVDGARAAFALTFRDPGTLFYSGTVFTESGANNGTIASPIGITLANAEFAGSNGEDFVATGKAAVYHLPNGLTPVVRRTGPQSLTVQLNGEAAAHASANDVANVELYLRNGAFATGNAKQYANASRGDLRLDFIDAPATPIATTTPGGGGSTGGTGGTGGGGGGGIPFFPGIPGVGASPSASPTPTPTPKPAPTPTPSPTPAPSQGPLLPQSQLPNATTLPEQALSVSKTTDSRGQTTVTVKADGDELLRLLSSGGAGTGAGAAVVIPVDGSADHAQVQLPGSAIGAAAEQSPDAVVAVQSGSVSFELPVKLFGAGGEASSLLGGSGSTVTVSMEKVSGTTGQQLSATAASNGLTLLGDAFNFTVAVESGGTATEVTDFNGTYVTRTMALAADAATGNLSAVVYDPATGQFAFVPATIEIANGVAVVRISSPHNSIYTVASVARTFADLNGHWAKADIELLASKLVVQGVTDSSFKPDASITRAEFASLLVRALGIAAGAGPAKPTFADAQPGDWYYAAVEAAARAGLVQGDDQGRFAPQATIKREEMAAMLVRALRYAGWSPYAGDATKLLAPFEDAGSISGWARDAVAQAIDAGLAGGMTDRSFAPSQEASRAQAAVMLKRLLKTLHFID